MVGARTRALGLMLLVGACGGGGGAGDDDPVDARPAADAAPDGPPDLTVVETRTVRIGPLAIAPGAEATVCVVVDLGNDVPRMVRSIRSTHSAGPHPVIPTPTAAAPSPTPTACGPFAGGSVDSEVLLIAQQSAATLIYPAGAGLPVAAHQSVHLEMHYVNAGDAELPIGGELALDLAAADAGLAPVGLLFTGNANLHIAAHGTATVTSFHPMPEGSALFATTAHTHQWGRRATVELVASATDPAPRLLHDSTDWAERPLDAFAPIPIAAGQGLRLTCTFDNQSDQDVSFGLGANDEMCFVWAHLVEPHP